MFFKDHLVSIATIIDAKFQAYLKVTKKHPADKGEICEIFLKEFLQDSLGDCFKIFRGGYVVNSNGDESKQIDVILTDKKAIKLFGDKGIYAHETVKGCFSITSTLDKAKLIKCCEEFKSLPKSNYTFGHFNYVSKEIIDSELTAWKWLAPYKVIFAYQGEIKDEWVGEIVELTKDCVIPYNAAPDLIIVNKWGYMEKLPPVNVNDLNTTQNQILYTFAPFSRYPNIGTPFGKILYNMSTFSESVLYPDLSNYFNQDMLNFEK